MWKILLLRLFLVLLSGNFIIAEEPEPASFSQLNYQDLTNNSNVFQIPFKFAIPEDYVVTSDKPDSTRNVVLHKSDLLRVNKNGGIIEPEIFEYPFFAVEASMRFGFLGNGKFSVENGAQDFGSDYSSNYEMKRIDQKQLPILIFQSKDSKKEKVRFLLISPNYGTWVFELRFFDSAKHVNFSAHFWQKIIATLSGEDKNIQTVPAPRKAIEPWFPDSAKFSNDIYSLSVYRWKPMAFPKKLPVVKITTEVELNVMMPEAAIKDRLTFLSPISWQKGGEKFSFDKFIEYEIVQDYKQNENSNPPTYSRVGFWEFQVFLLKGIVVGYNMLHMSTGPSGQYEPDKQSITKIPIKGDKRALENAYLAQRHPLFKKAHMK